MRRWFKRIAWIASPMLLLWTAWMAYLTCRPIPPLPIERETTFFLTPIDEDTGGIDYETALNLHLRRGIQPEKNVILALLPVFAPSSPGEEMAYWFYRYLQPRELPIKGKPFRRFLVEAEERFYFDGDVLPKLGEIPWNLDVSPQFAEWLLENQEALAIAARASLLPDYYHPLVDRPGDARWTYRTSLFAEKIGLPGLGGAYALRAMAYLGGGSHDLAWGDLMTMQRFARLMARGGTFREYASAVELEVVASQAMMTVLSSPGLTAEQATRFRDAWQRLPATPPLADKMEYAERIKLLGRAEDFRTGREDVAVQAAQYSESELRYTARPESWVSQRRLERYDWSPMYRRINGHCDRLVRALRLPTRFERDAEFRAINAEWVILRNNMADPRDVGLSERSHVESGGDILLMWLMPRFQKVRHLEDILEQNRHLMNAAFALALAKLDAGAYPETIEVPDLFSGKLCIYRREGDGYLLYSVGPDGIDDGGMEQTDDLSVRLPRRSVEVIDVAPREVAP